MKGNQEFRLSPGQEALIRQASAAAAGASDDDLDALAEAYKRSRVSFPSGGVVPAIGGALLALRFAKVAAYEGHPRLRDAAWSELMPVAVAFGLDRYEVAMLTTVEDELKRILEPHKQESNDG